MGVAPVGFLRQRTHGGNPWRLMREGGLTREQILDFSVDLNPLGFPERVPAAILRHMEDIRHYPDPDALALREAMAAYHRIPVEAILPGNGSAELISLLTRIQPIARALVLAPTFTEYEWALEQAGAATRFKYVEETNQFQPDFSATDWPAILQEVDLVFLCNPNNPTGVALPKGQVQQLAHRCLEAGALLVVDEAFVEFVDRPEEISVIPEALHLENVVVLRSLTKCFAIPGLRLGYLVASESVVERSRALQQPWPLNAFAMSVGIELFGQVDYLARSRHDLREQREKFLQGLRAIPGLQPFPSAVNFILCKLTHAEVTSSGLSQSLARRGIVIRTCDSFTGLEPGRFIRLAVRTRQDNERLVAEVREVFAHAS